MTEKAMATYSSVLPWRIPGMGEPGGLPSMGFPGSSAGKESACNAGDPSSIPGSGRSSGEGIGYLTPLFLGFPGGSGGKESACNAGHQGSMPGLGRSPGGGHGNLVQYSCLENPNGQRWLVGYSWWGPKESDVTKNSTCYVNVCVCMGLPECCCCCC